MQEIIQTLGKQVRKLKPFVNQKGLGGPENNRVEKRSASV